MTQYLPRQRQLLNAGAPLGSPSGRDRFRALSDRTAPARTKNKRAHIVPPSNDALAILQTIPLRHGRNHLFGTGKGPFSGWSKSKERLDGRLGGQIAPWALHDLRRSFASHCADLEFGSVLAIEAAPNHLSGERAGIKGIYNRGKQERQKRELMDKWAAHIGELVEPPAPRAIEPSATAGRRAGQLLFEGADRPEAPPPMKVNRNLKAPRKR